MSLCLPSSTIKIKSPKGKEKLKIGQNHTIKWKVNKKTDKTEKIKNTVSSSENWSEFYDDLISEKHTDLAELSKPELKKKLNQEGDRKSVV